MPDRLSLLIWISEEPSQYSTEYSRQFVAIFKHYAISGALKAACFWIGLWSTGPGLEVKIT